MFSLSPSFTCNLKKMELDCNKKLVSCLVISSSFETRHFLLLYTKDCASPWNSVLGIKWGNSRHFGTPLRFSTKWRLRNERRNFVLMTCHYPDLGSASDWSYRKGNLFQPIRITTQIWVMTRRQYGISRGHQR